MNGKKVRQKCRTFCLKKLKNNDIMKKICVGEKNMNILTIGNSYSEDATRYLHDVAYAQGDDIQVTNLYVGGCTLERHYRNMLSKRNEYQLIYNGARTGFFVSIEEAIGSKSWDVITLQQSSPLAFDKESYFPYIDELLAYVKKFSPKCKIYLHQTWSYEDGNEWFKTSPYKNLCEMIPNVARVYGEVADKIGADGIIKCGELMLSMYKAGITPLWRDGWHASKGVGRYAMGLLWYRTLTGKSVADNGLSYFDEPIPDFDIAKVKEIVDSIEI